MNVRPYARDYILRPYVYLFVVVLAGGATALISRHTDAWLAYGLLSGWWAGLVVASWRCIRLRSAVTVVALVALVCLLAPAFEWRWYQKDLPTEIDFEWVLVALMQGLALASPIFVVALLRPIFRRLEPQNPARHMRVNKDAVVLGGMRPPGHLISMIHSYREILKARIGEEWDIPWETGAKIARCYLEILEFLRRGEPLPESDIASVREDIERYDDLIEKLARVYEKYREIPLWPGEHNSVRSALSDEIITEKFSTAELLRMRHALEEYSYAVRSFWWDEGMTEDDHAEVWDDGAFDRYALEKVQDALVKTLQADQLEAEKRRRKQRRRRGIGHRDP